jgi:hypothetical protein
MMHVKFYAISVLFLIAVGACFLLIAFGHGPDSGIAADNVGTQIINQPEPITHTGAQGISEEEAPPQAIPPAQTVPAGSVY